MSKISTQLRRSWRSRFPVYSKKEALIWFGIRKNRTFCLLIMGVYTSMWLLADLDVVERYEFVLDLCKDYSTPPSDYGVVAVIDGGYDLPFCKDLTTSRAIKVDTLSYSEYSSANVWERSTVVVNTNTHLLRLHRTIFCHPTTQSCWYRHLVRFHQNQNLKPENHPCVQVSIPIRQSLVNF